VAIAAVRQEKGGVLTEREPVAELPAVSATLPEVARRQHAALSHPQLARTRHDTPLERLREIRAIETNGRVGDDILARRQA
jgi:hypothetical protein